MAKTPQTAGTKRKAPAKKPPALSAKKAATKKAPTKAARKTAAKKPRKAGAKAKMAAVVSSSGASTPGRLIPDPGSATVRMYRIGHGDCFLLAFPPETAGSDPIYVMIDCGYKPGSPGKIEPPRTMKDIADSIRAATGGHIHLMIITHEHQDHLNGLTQTYFKDFKFGEVWCAWTEDGSDAFANMLRERFNDRLVGLMLARRSLATALDRLSAAGDRDMARAARRMHSRVSELLALEIGGEDDDEATISSFERELSAARKTERPTSRNKTALAFVKDRAENGIRCLRPHERILKVSGTAGVRAFVLGPPRNEKQLLDLDPVGEEEFHIAPFGADASNARTVPLQTSPFAARHSVSLDDSFFDGRHGAFFREHYGNGSSGRDRKNAETREVPDDAAWRRIEHDWMLSAESLAIAMNDYTNNTSLVVAFELGAGGNVLLFTADAQRGNWLSWDRKSFKDGEKKLSVKDLLARTVLLKVGHHGSHNATLNGHRSSKYPSLGWIAAQGDAARQFTAMITAVPAWAKDQPGWNHPLKAIEDALLDKSGGRVFRTDLDRKAMERRRPDDDKKAWKSFLDRTVFDDLYFDYKVPFEE